MSPAPRSSAAASASQTRAPGDGDWRPTADRPALQRRAELLAAIRGFFLARGVLEVETPLLCAAASTDPHLHNLSATVRGPDGARRLHLQTSPESAMKRLLAAGSGSIYQVCKAFRDDEGGRLHNPEFTLLEWYRCDWDHYALMDEVEALTAAVLGMPPAQRHTYCDVFRRFTGLDLTATAPQRLRECAADHGYHGANLDAADDLDVYLDFLMGCVVTPRLGHDAPAFVYDFPASQAAMARVRQGPFPVAERFELFVRGIELANGYHELSDAREQRSRMLGEARRRGVRPDERLLAALDHGLPDCAGVALGVDRLLMLMTGAAHLDQVLTFPVRMA